MISNLILMNGLILQTMISKCLKNMIGNESTQKSLVINLNLNLNLNSNSFYAFLFKIQGKLKDESSGHQIIKFVALQSKTYCKLIEKDDNEFETCKAKGVDKHKIKQLTSNHYESVLSKKDSFKQSINRIEIKLADIKSIKFDKICLKFGDDKRFQIPNSFKTLAYGNKKIKEYHVDDDDDDDNQ